MEVVVVVVVGQILDGPERSDRISGRVWRCWRCWGARGMGSGEVVVVVMEGGKTVEKGTCGWSWAYVAGMGARSWRCYCFSTSEGVFGGDRDRLRSGKLKFLHVKCFDDSTIEGLARLSFVMLVITTT